MNNSLKTIFWIITIITLSTITVFSALSISDEEMIAFNAERMIAFNAIQNFDTSDSFVFNDSELPKTGTTQLNLTLQSNSTIYIINNLVDNNAIITFPSSYYLNNTATTNILFNYSVQSFLIHQNRTIINSFNISNSLNNVTKSYAIIINITSKGEELVTTNPVYNLITDTKSYFINISEDFLPFNGTFVFNLNGKAGTRFNLTTCSTWMTCPTNITFNSTSTYILNIPYQIPFNAILGTHNLSFWFEGYNITEKAEIDVVIISSQLLFKKYVFEERCFVDDASIESCLEEERVYRNQQLIDYFQFKNRPQNNTGYNNTIKEYVMVGSVDDEIKTMYNSCSSELLIVRSGLSECNNNRNNLLNEKTLFDEKIKQNEEMIKNKEAIISNNTQSMIDENNSKMYKTLYATGAFLFLLVALVGLRLFNKRFNHY